MPSRIERRIRASRSLSNRARHLTLLAIVTLALGIAACGPSEREFKNRRELEALLTAVSLRNQGQLAKSVVRIVERHDSGELCESSFHRLMQIVEAAKSGDWSGAESRAYAYREEHPYFQ